MKTSDKYKYWAMLADYDIETAKALIDAERSAYVSYMCQQCLERQLKGMYVYYLNMEAPKSHNLPYLFEKIKEVENFPEHGERDIDIFNEFEDFFTEVMFYYVSDYPFSYKKITSRFIDNDIAEELYNQTVIHLEKLRQMQPLPEKVDLENIE